jgi:hypothetical protein
MNVIKFLHTTVAQAAIMIGMILPVTYLGFNSNAYGSQVGDFFGEGDEETEAVPDNGIDEGGANATASTATPAGSQAPPARRANHSLIFSEHIPLTGQLASNDYILLMDLTSYQTTTNRAHIVIKVPCDENGLPQAVVAAGNNISGLQTLDLSAGIVNNVILDGGSVDLSQEGGSCLYSSDLPSRASLIILRNNSGNVLNFSEGNYSVAITVRGLWRE